MVTFFFFPLFSSVSLHASLATQVKYLRVETAIKAPWIVFLLTFPEGGRKTEILSLETAKTFTLDAPD